MSTISTKLRKSAKGQSCCFRIPGVCCHDNSTVVLCHAPSGQKGMGNKSSDWWAAFGCHTCHEAVDLHNVVNPHELWMQAINETWQIWVKMGLIVVPETAKPAEIVGLPRKRLYR